MTRPVRALALLVTVATAALLGACGTEKIRVAADSPYHYGAVLFSQRCSGCHTLAYAGTHGSAANVRTAMANNGPNFDVRCERPITRVLYAIQNGGFSGAIMPQNIVVGPDAKAVAAFVSEYAGRQAPTIVGQTPCESQAVGTLPSPSQSATAASPSATTSGGAGAQTNIAQRAPATSAKTKPGTKTGTGTTVKTSTSTTKTK